MQSLSNPANQESKGMTPWKQVHARSKKLLKCNHITAMQIMCLTEKQNLRCILLTLLDTTIENSQRPGIAFKN